MTGQALPARPATDSKAFRFWLTVLTLAGIVWLGGSLYRGLIVNEMFIPGTVEFDPGITHDQEQVLFQLISAASLMVLIAYTLALISVLAILRMKLFRLKDNGWLLMALLLFFPFVPIEAFIGYLDVEFILLWEKTKDVMSVATSDVYAAQSTLLRETVAHRLNALSGVPFIAALSYITAVVVVVWQPMRRKTSYVEAAE